MLSQGFIPKSKEGKKEAKYKSSKFVSLPLSPCAFISEMMPWGPTQYIAWGCACPLASPRPSLISILHCLPPVPLSPPQLRNGPSPSYILPWEGNRLLDSPHPRLYPHSTIFRCQNFERSASLLEAFIFSSVKHSELYLFL